MSRKGSRCSGFSRPIICCWGKLCGATSTHPCHQSCQARHDTANLPCTTSVMGIDAARCSLSVQINIDRHISQMRYPHVFVYNTSIKS
eukprot:3821585-Amphidinium_carterae.1